MSGREAHADDPDEVVYRTTFFFNAIYVLESLASGEFKTGQKLYDDVIFPRTRELTGAFTQFVAIPNREELIRQLDVIRSSAQTANHKPIVHIEAHGTTDGIELADGSLLKWSEIAPLFAAINEASGFNLTVVAVSCEGWNLTYALMPSDRAPVALLIGPPDKMSAEELLEAMGRMYDTLVRTIDLNAACEAMNEHRPYHQWRIKPATAEVLFCRVFHQYVTELSTTENLQERENRLVADIVRARSLDVLQSAVVRVDVRSNMTNHQYWYDHLRERFFMIDIFPDNRARLGLTYAKCMGKAS